MPARRTVRVILSTVQARPVTEMRTSPKLSLVAEVCLLSSVSLPR